MRQQLTFLLLALGLPFFTFAQIDIYDSGGPLLPEQAAYDVTFYDLDLTVAPGERSIRGSVTLEADIVHPMYELVLNLDTLLTVNHVEETAPDGALTQRPFRHQNGLIHISLGHTRQPGERLRVRVHYGGQPRVAPHAPWDGGFNWETTPSGQPWIATSCQGQGADIWWPCKDHVSDEPDSAGLHIRVPQPLVVATNGRLQEVETHDDESRTYHFFVSTPINIYNVALNIAPYQTLMTDFASIAGDTFPFVFYVLPEDYTKGERLFPEMQEHLHWYESLFGPYPFRADKYGVAQTPHLGMEHQTIIAYGANFRNTSMTGGKDWGFDALHHHELAHEWWGNLVTNSDWRDMWLHEGFGSYMQALYSEHLRGKKAYFEYMSNIRRFPTHRAIAPREVTSAREIYQAPIYVKGAWVLHALRYLIGDEAFFRALRRMAYPDPALEKITDGRQCRFATTDDFLSICEEESGQELDWFFEVYLRQATLPRLRSEIAGNMLHLSWEAPEGLPFPMPVTVEVGERRLRLNVPPEGMTYEFQPGQKPVVDPDGWLLFEPVQP